MSRGAVAALLAAAALALLLGAGCDTGGGPARPDAQDAATDTADDVATDAAQDAPAPDTAPDVAPDVTPDVAAGAVPLVAMSFNVLCSFCDPENFDPWPDRLEAFRDIFARHDPDLVGLQEVSFAPEVEQLRALLPGFEAVFYRAEGTFVDWPDATVLYRASRFELVESGRFWLSPTPDVPGSIGFAEQQLARLVQWVRLHDRANDADLVFATTHFDNNPPSQELSAPLLLERLGPLIAAYPTVITGDFNSQPFDEAYRILVEGATAEGPRLTDAYELAAARAVVTNQEPAPDYDAEGRIDHVFVAGAPWRCARWAVDLSVYGADDRYPSDHWPVLAECGW